MLPQAHQANGAVYAFWINALPSKGAGVLFGRIGSVLMPEERSADIDTEFDFCLAESILKKRRGAPRAKPVRRPSTLLGALSSSKGNPEQRPRLEAAACVEGS